MADDGDRQEKQPCPTQKYHMGQRTDMESGSFFQTGSVTDGLPSVRVLRKIPIFVP